MTGLLPERTWPLFQVFLVSVFIPFIRIPGLTSETSMFASIAAVLFLLSVFSNFIRTRESRDLFVLLLTTLATLNLSFFLYESTYFGSFLRMYISLFQGFLVFFVTKTYFGNQYRDVVGKLILAWIIVGFLQCTPLASAINAVLGQIFTRSSEAADNRGIQILANEPSYAAIHLLVFIPLVALLQLKHHRIIQALLVLLVLLTKSANGILLFGGLIVIFLIVFKKTNVLALIVLVIALALSSLPLILDNFDSRAASVLKIVITNPDLLLSDPSIASRYWIILSNYLGWFSSPFIGNGLGSFSITQDDIFRAYDISAYEISRQLDAGQKVPYMSFFGGILNDVGILGAAVYLFLFVVPGVRSKIPEIKVLVILVVFIQLQTISFSLPIQWFILGMAANDRFQKKA